VPSAKAQTDRLLVITFSPFGTFYKQIGGGGAEARPLSQNLTLWEGL
jgi:hypothetical protein